MENQVKAVILLKTDESDIKEDKNGKIYKTIELTKHGSQSGLEVIDGIEVMVEAKAIVTKTNVYEESYLDGKTELGFNAPIYDRSNPKAGGAFYGDIVTKTVEPYDIPLRDENGELTGEVRTVTSYTTVVLGVKTTDTDRFEAAVNRAFANRQVQVEAGVEAGAPSAVANPVASPNVPLQV
jgi:hypothetical protein